jgi:hypothetical protein
MPMGKHYGSFAKGFSDSLIAMMRLGMTMQLYQARAQYYKDRGWAATHPHGAGADKAALQDEMNRIRNDPNYGRGGGGAEQVRNNNPGNLRDGDFAKSQPGYVGRDERGFAKFDSVQNGSNAIDGLLSKNYSGMTLNQLFAKYAPASDHNDPVAYAKTVAGHLGISPDAVPDLNDPKVRDALRQSIVSVEQGVPYDRVPTYLAGSGGGGDEGRPALINASDSLHATGGADASQMHPAFANRAAQLSAEAEKATGQPISFNELHRTYEQQASIRAEHERMPGGVDAHPAARPGTSYHEIGAAGDMDDNKASRWAKTPGPDGLTPIQRIGLEQLPGKTGQNDPNHIQLPRTDWGKTARAAPPPGSYQVAGDTDIALTPEQAEKSRRDLEAHRAQPQFDVPPGPREADVPPPPDPHEAPEPDTTIRRPSELPPPPTTQEGPESPYAPPDQNVYNTRPPSPSDQPSSGVGASVHQIGPAIPPHAVATTNLDPRTTPYGPGPQQGPPQRTGAPPNVGITPSAIPSRPVMGPPQRTGAPPNVGITPSSVRETTPQMGPEGPGRTTLPPAYSHMPTQQNVPGQVAVGTPTDADKPAPAAQPVSSPAGPAVTQPSNQPGGGRFTMVARPNADPTQPGRGGAPMSTALDLSHLWGPNPPLSERAPQPVQPNAPSSPAQGQILSPPGGGPTPYPGPTMNPSGNIVLTQGQGARGGQSVSAPMPPPRPQDFGDVATASRKGGPIQRFAAGGAIPSKPVTRFYGGGSGVDPAPQGAPYSPQQTWYGTDTAGTALERSMDNLVNPGTDPAGSTGPMQSYTNVFLPGGGYSPNFNALTPAQQTWYNSASTDLSQGVWEPSGLQDAMYASLGAAPGSTPPPAPAPAAPAPAPVINPPSVQNITNMPAATTIVDPTTQTTTGIPGVPNVVQAKSYDPNVDAQTGAGFANTSSTGGTNYSVGSTDLLNQTTPGTISGTGGTILSRKGGPIPRQRFAKGGIPTRPTMKFADAGTVPYTPVGFQGSRTPAEQYYFSPQYVGPDIGGGWSGTPESQLAPNQQAWADQQQQAVTLEGQQGQQASAFYAAGGTGDPFGAGAFSQFSIMPNAVWPAAPTAPTPLSEPAPAPQSIVNQGQPIVDIATIDPTATTTTGIPGVPNVVQAKSYDPNVDAQTGASFANTSSTGGTNYSVGSNDLLNQTTPGQISGGNTTILSRKGGPLLKRVKRFDLGGGVDQSGDVSASALGMPPGLSGGGGGGAQPIPPYYYNPATYAGAGAPVGKGVSQTSAPVYKAGAIPTLPMMRGGAVAFDDGGGVDPGAGDMAALQNLSYMDMQDEREDAQSAPAAAPPAPVTQYNTEGEPISDVNPNEFLQPAQADQASSGRDSTPPADPTQPQISDDRGNPSRGLIGAITSGLHWLGDHLGLVGGAQAHPAIATDPNTQTNRQLYSTNSPDGQTYFTHQNAEELKDINDPNHQLQGMYRNIAALEGGWKWAMARGDDATAGRLAAGFLHYSVLASQNLSKQAADALYNGDLKRSVDLTNEALDAVPDGRNIRVALNPDGKTVTVTGSTLTGQQLWQQYGSAPEILDELGAAGQASVECVGEPSGQVRPHLRHHAESPAAEHDRWG